jgi:hypothetical protein
MISITEVGMIAFFINWETQAKIAADRTLNRPDYIPID